MERENPASTMFLPYDSPESLSPKEMRQMVDYGTREKKHPIVGCNANAHHTNWGSTTSITEVENF